MPANGKPSVTTESTLHVMRLNYPSLEVSYLARRAGLLDGSPSAVPFALLASIRDNSGRGDLHDRVRTQFPVLTPLPRNRALIPAMRAQV